MPNGDFHHIRPAVGLAFWPLVSKGRSRSGRFPASSAPHQPPRTSLHVGAERAEIRTLNELVVKTPEVAFRGLDGRMPEHLLDNERAHIAL